MKNGSLLKKRYNEIKYNNLKPAEQCAQIGDMITIEYICENKQLTFLLSEKQDDSGGVVVSTSAPIGKAVFGQVVGDILDVPAPSGIKQIKIIEIKKQKI